MRDAAWVVKPSVETSVDMANCSADMLGFCYTEAIRPGIVLERRERYFHPFSTAVENAHTITILLWKLHGRPTVISRSGGFKFNPLKALIE